MYSLATRAVSLSNQRSLIYAVAAWEQSELLLDMMANSFKMFPLWVGLLTVALCSLKINQVTCELEYTSYVHTNPPLNQNMHAHTQVHTHYTYTYTPHTPLSTFGGAV